jgi:hypothetical protein
VKRGNRLCLNKKNRTAVKCRTMHRDTPTSKVATRCILRCLQAEPNSALG